MRSISDGEVADSGLKPSGFELVGVGAVTGYADSDDCNCVLICTEAIFGGGTVEHGEDLVDACLLLVRWNLVSWMKW